MTRLIALQAALLTLGLPLDSVAEGHSTAYMPPPSHGTRVVAHGHPSGGHGFGNFFRTLLGIEIETPPGAYAGPTNVEYVVVRPMLQVSVKSEAERYYDATGRNLPAVHDLIVLPPSGPGGDSSYIWPTSDDR